MTWASGVACMRRRRPHCRRWPTQGHTAAVIELSMRSLTRGGLDQALCTSMTPAHASFSPLASGPPRPTGLGHTCAHVGCGRQR